MAKVTHGEMMSMTAIPRCPIAARLREVSCFLLPENERATKLHPRLMAIAHRSIGGCTFAVPFFFLDPFPTSGAWTPAVTFSIKDHIHHLILPSLVMAVVIMSDIMRYARASMLDVIREDYITTARAKGLRSLQVILGHAFRNALLPLITIIALKLPWIFGGSSILETVFQWPGIGSLFIEAAVARDYYIVMALLMVYGGAVVFAGLIADIAYAIADPRIKYK